MLTRLSRTLSVLALLGSATTAHASSVLELSLTERIQKADLIAEATVLSVKHRNSTVAGPEQVALPHTFVTFRIERIIKGWTGSKELTLRFRGGPDGTGREMIVVGAPTFQPGDRDILFVAGNGERTCPLIGWHQGRFRVVGNELFDEFGHEIWVSPDNRLVAGRPALELEAFPYRARNEPDEAVAQTEIVPPAGSMRPDVDSFVYFLNDLTMELAEKGALARPRQTLSVDPEQPFHIERSRPMAPPKLARAR